jgi:hypothetical protein
MLIGYLPVVRAQQSYRAAELKAQILPKWFIGEAALGYLFIALSTAACLCEQSAKRQ